MNLQKYLKIQKYLQKTVSPMTHLRNLVSSQMFKMMNKKTKNWKTIVKMFKEE